MLPSNLVGSILDSVNEPIQKTVLVFGACGLLGSTLCPELKAHGYSVIRQSRGENGDIVCNPLDKDDVCSTLSLIQPASVINLIALSNVDYCESYLSEAYAANVKSIDVLRFAIKNTPYNPHLIHISTDHVYSGAGPHSEDSTSPLNIYGLSKFTGELLALQVGATVLRTNFYGKSITPFRQSFSDWIFESLVSGREFTVFDDVHFSALGMKSLAKYIVRALHVRAVGIFNVGTRDGVSKAEFASRFAEFLGLNTDKMRIGSIDDLKNSVIRPTDMRLDVSYFEEVFKKELPYMNEQIKEIAAEYKGM